MGLRLGGLEDFTWNNPDRKLMKRLIITNGPATRMSEWNQLIQFSSDKHLSRL